MQTNKDGLFDPKQFLVQFEFTCKYNKNFNRCQDCTDYLGEMKKEILLTF